MVTSASDGLRAKRPQFSHYSRSTNLSESFLLGYDKTLKALAANLQVVPQLQGKKIDLNPTQNKEKRYAEKRFTPNLQSYLQASIFFRMQTMVVLHLYGNIPRE